MEQEKHQLQVILDELGISKNLGTILKVLAIILVIYFLWPRPHHQAAGILVDQEPDQQITRQPAWNHKGYTIKPLASYSIRGRILSKYYYWEQTSGWALFDTVSDLSAMDLALGWKKMSDENFVNDYIFHQDGRFLTWTEKESARDDPYPITYEEMNRSLSNNHIIPANQVVRDKLDKAIEGDIVELKGYLVEVTAPEFRGASWHSSLSRTDKGDGACEIMWVDDVKIIR